MNNDQNSNSNSNPTISCGKRKYQQISASSASQDSMSFNANQQRQKNVEHRTSQTKSTYFSNEDNLESNPKQQSKPRKRRRVLRNFKYIDVECIEECNDNIHQQNVSLPEDDDNKDNYPSTEQSPGLSASPETPEPLAFHLLQQQHINHQQMASKGDTAITFIVFDYDDTIFPTYAIKQIFSRKKVIDNKIVYDSIQNCSQYSYQGLLARASPQEIKQLEKLSMITYQMLCYYLNQYSNKNIVIVSSACKNWMRQSLQILLDIGVYYS